MNNNYSQKRCLYAKMQFQFNFARPTSKIRHYILQLSEQIILKQEENIIGLVSKQKNLFVLDIKSTEKAMIV